MRVNKFMHIRIAVAVSEGRWIAYGAHDTQDAEVIDMLRESVQDHRAIAWIELELPGDLPAQVVAKILSGTQVTDDSGSENR
jgi:hypothetical protein